MKLPVLAERSVRREFDVPNPQVLRQILDNMLVVVKHLENTRVALGRRSTWVIPLDYEFGTSS